MAPGVDTDVFLACCLRHCKDKPQIDFQLVAHELGMSVGGVQNKFRDVMKRLQSGGDGKTPTTLKGDKTQPKAKDAPAKTTNKRKVPNAKKEEETRSTSNLDDTVVEVQDGEGFPESESPKKKRKPATKSKKSAAAVEDRDSSSDMGHVEKTPAKKHVKPAATRVDTKKGSDCSRDREESSEDEAPAEEIESTKKLDLSKVTDRGIKVKKHVAADTANPKDDEIEEASGYEDKGQSANKSGTTKPKRRARKYKKTAVEEEKEESDTDTTVPKPKPASKVKTAHGEMASSGSTNDHRVEVNIPSRPFAPSLKSEKPPKSPVEAKQEEETVNREAENEADEGDIVEVEGHNETAQDVV